MWILERLISGAMQTDSAVREAVNHVVWRHSTHRQQWKLLSRWNGLWQFVTAKHLDAKSTFCRLVAFHWTPIALHILFLHYFFPCGLVCARYKLISSFNWHSGENILPPRPNSAFLYSLIDTSLNVFSSGCIIPREINEYLNNNNNKKKDHSGPTPILHPNPPTIRHGRQRYLLGEGHYS